MKVLLLAIALLTANEALADRRGSPFPPAIDKRFDEVEDQLEDQTEAVGLARKQARFVYDVAVDGGSSTANKALGVTLPAGAILTKAMLYINTAFTDGGNGSVALQCGGTRNITGWLNLDVYPAPSLFLGAFEDSQTQIIDHSAQVLINAESPTYLASFNSVGTACEITAVVRGDSGYTPYTAGKLTGIIEYFSNQ